MADQRGGGGFAVGPGDGDHGRFAGLGGIGTNLARKQFDIADHRHLGVPAWVTTSCGRGWVSGTPGLRIKAAIFSHAHSRQGVISAPA